MFLIRPEDHQEPSDPECKGVKPTVSNQKQIIQQTKFTSSPLKKAFQKRTKTIQDQAKKQVAALKSLESFDKPLPSIKDFISKERLNPEIIVEIERIEKEGKKTERNKMVYKGYNKTSDFRKFETIRVFGNDIRNNFINMSMISDEKNYLAKHIREFKNKARERDPNLKRVKEDVLNSAMALLKGREIVFKKFES